MDNTGYSVFFEYKIIDSHSIKINRHNKSCIDEYYAMKVDYFEDIEQIVFSCITIDGGIQAVIYNKIIENISEPIYTISKFEDCEIYGYSILYSNYINDYVILSDTKCNGIEYPFEKLFERIDSKEDEEE